MCGTNLCDQRLTRIIRINKTRTEKCHFTVIANAGNTRNSQLIDIRN